MTEKKIKVHKEWRDANIGVFVITISVLLILLNTKDSVEFNYRVQTIFVRMGLFIDIFASVYFLLRRKYILEKTLNSDHHKIGDVFLVISALIITLSFIFVIDLKLSDYLFYSIMILFIFALLYLVLFKTKLLSSKSKNAG